MYDLLKLQQEIDRLKKENTSLKKEISSRINGYVQCDGCGCDKDAEYYYCYECMKDQRE